MDGAVGYAPTHSGSKPLALLLCKTPMKMAPSVGNAPTYHELTARLFACQTQRNKMVLAEGFAPPTL